VREGLDLQVDLRVYGDAVIATVLRLRWLLSGLLVAATVLFAIVVAGERAQHDQHVEGAAHVEGEGESAEHQDEAAASGEHGEERTLGVDRESNAVVLPAVVVSLVLAVLVWFRRDLWLLWTVVALALVFAVFDVAEVVHQLNENRNVLALLAAIVALMHLAAAWVAEIRATHSLPSVSS
jgi:hypothetical protein